jgi:hypothetical protein
MMRIGRRCLHLRRYMDLTVLLFSIPYAIIHLCPLRSFQKTRETEREGTWRQLCPFISFHLIFVTPAKIMINGKYIGRKQKRRTREKENAHVNNEINMCSTN